MKSPIYSKHNLRKRQPQRHIPSSSGSSAKSSSLGKTPTITSKYNTRASARNSKHNSSPTENVNRNSFNSPYSNKSFNSNSNVSYVEEDEMIDEEENEDEPTLDELEDLHEQNLRVRGREVMRKLRRRSLSSYYKNSSIDHGYSTRSRQKRISSNEDEQASTKKGEINYHLRKRDPNTNYKLPPINLTDKELDTWNKNPSKIDQPIIKRFKANIINGDGIDNFNQQESQKEAVYPDNMIDLEDHRPSLKLEYINKSMTKNYNTEIDFSKVGGLESHINKLREMIVLPLLYPQLYEKVGIKNPKGVIFHGPPGTGKTLVAKALINLCSNSNIKTAFFSRKASDCLSKWVGEAERNLRELFESAKKWQPSIVFFDEFDGLAPSRDEKHDQTYTSIVSTLLSLMDGLDPRGQVVVIVSTNKINLIDSAFRRPGRFDRELFFPLPDKMARKEILEINLKQLSSCLSQRTFDFIVEKTKNYCGADIRGLCNEAALISIRRDYPQLYKSNNKYQIDHNLVLVKDEDFIEALKTLKPSISKSSRIESEKLNEYIEPAYIDQVKDIKSYSNSLMGEQVPFIVVESEMNETTNEFISTILYSFDAYNVVELSLFTIFTASSASEDKIISLLKEFISSEKAILYIKYLDVLLENLHQSAQSIIVEFLCCIDTCKDKEHVVICTATRMEYIDHISKSNQARFELPVPKKELVVEALDNLITLNYSKTQTYLKNKRAPVELQLAPINDTAKMVNGNAPTTANHENTLKQKSSDLRELRYHLRTITNELMKNRDYKVFTKPPVHSCDYEGLYDINTHIDLTLIMQKLGDGYYTTLDLYRSDIDKMMNSYQGYSESIDDKRTVFKCHSIRDAVEYYMESIDEELVARCTYYDELQPTCNGHVLEQHLAVRNSPIRYELNDENDGLVDNQTLRSPVENEDMQDLSNDKEIQLTNEYAVYELKKTEKETILELAKNISEKLKITGIKELNRIAKILLKEINSETIETLKASIQIILEKY